MSFPIPVKYNLTAEGDATLVIYSDGKELELLPTPAEGGSGMTQELFNQFVTEWVSGNFTIDRAVINPDNLLPEVFRYTTLKELFFKSRLTFSSPSMFCVCPKLEMIIMPFIEFNARYLFDGCSKLEIADLGTTYMPGETFRYCENINKIIMRSKSRVSLAAVSAFSSTPFANGGKGGDIYIPKALYDNLYSGSDNDYIASAMWKTLNSYKTITWHPIEGSEYEFNYADGTPIDSIPVPE